MKRSIVKQISLMAIVLVALVATSCNDDYENDVYRSFATVVGDAKQFKLRTDEGYTLVITENAVPGFVVENNMRVIAQYKMLEEANHISATKGYNVRLDMLWSVLSKKPVLASNVLSQAAQDSLGYDPINSMRMWGVEGFLNVEFDLRFDNSGLKHFINLVVDDEKSTDEEVFATFRHNAFNDAPIRSSVAVVSFNSDILLPADKDSVNVHVSYKNYQDEIKTKSIMLKRKDVSVSQSKRDPFTISTLIK